MVGMWKFVSYEACGRGHRQASIPCQDKTIAARMGGVDVIALADGAGSARLSHFGAETVVAAACRYVAENYETILGEADAGRVRSGLLRFMLAALEEKSAELSCSLTDLSSTLLLAAVGAGSYFIAHIGDGVVGCLKNDELKVASAPENGEFANTTTFVTSRDALRTMRLFRGPADDIAGFVLMSDGAAESFYQKKDKRLAAVIVKMMRHNVMMPRDILLPMLAESFERVVVPHTQDDCSIALLSRAKGILGDYYTLPPRLRCELLEIGYNRGADRRLGQYDEILRLLEKWGSVPQLSREIHLDAKYVKRRLKRLTNAGLVIRKGPLYQAVSPGATAEARPMGD